MLAEQQNMLIQLLVLCVTALTLVHGGENARDLEISEGAAIGTRIGFIQDGVSDENGPPYLIIPVQGVSVDTDLDIDQKTGEIRTKVTLDREIRASYYFVAVPLNGQHIHITVRVIDENDNAPTFPSPSTTIEFSENTPRDVKRTLNAARDLDVGNFNTQRYNIVSGNVNNAFRLSYHREKDGVLYLDLQVNGVLDRETIPSYALVVEALDGGVPPLRGVMTVNVVIQDVNDNPPVFNQTRYLGEVPENATVGTTILKVNAVDVDLGDNGAVEYTINRRQSDKDGYFDINLRTGVVRVAKPLDFEMKEVHELVVVARDRGLQPLESTAFVSIKVTDVNDNQPSINLIFLSDDATPKISEDAETGDFVARISVNDPDLKNEYANVNVTLEGGDGRFGLTTQDSVIYLVIVSMPIDRELKSNYTLSVVATDTGLPPLHAHRTFELRVTDVNDNAPEFEQSQYYANVLEAAELGTSVLQVRATDRDEGANSEITYSLYETATDGRTSWFEVDAKTGVITTRMHVDCDTDSMPKLVVVASDGGSPSLSATATILVTIHDVNDNEPIFGQTFYNVTVPEDKPKGSCILKVSALDSDCGVNAMVNYTLLDAPSKNNPFYVKSISGEICIASDLDYETKNVYEFFVIATDRGGLSATSAVKISLTDVNDNEPKFWQNEYRFSIGDDVSANTAIGLVRALDPDAGHNGIVSYRLTHGNDENQFRVDRNTGELFVVRTKSLQHGRQYVLNVSATDGAGVKCVHEAQAFVTATTTTTAAAANVAVQFERSRYVFAIGEDASLNTVVGYVKAHNAISNGENQVVRYFVHNGDPGSWFSLDPNSGQLKTAAFLDYEKYKSVLLNVRAVYGNAASTTFTQIIVNLEDRNDNSPEFVSTAVRLSVPENSAIGTPLFAAFARDKDSGKAGKVRYFLSSGVGGGNNGGGGSGQNPSTNPSQSGLFVVDSTAGSISLTSSLDYEASQRHTLVLRAVDEGEPRLQTNLTVFLEVQDVNDNSPVFEQAEYSVTVSESLNVHSQIVQVIAVDLDTGNNAKISYKLADVKNGNGQPDKDTFGVSPNSGWIHLRRQLDRETTDAYVLKVTASDNGSIRNSASVTVRVSVSDANDNDPQFTRDVYEYAVEENKAQGTVFGTLHASDKDADDNAAVRYSLIPSNSSFQINPFSGVLSTRESLDREIKSVYELVAEARDQGLPSRSSRVILRVKVTDVNDNAPVIDDPQEDVISVREEQPPGTEVVRVRAVDLDDGYNATFTYSILKGRDTDGYGIFTIDPLTGIMRTRSVLDHEERSFYRIAVAATDNGIPPKQSVRTLRVEVLDVNDNRPTFFSSSLIFKIREDVQVGYVIGNVVVGESASQANRGHIMYKLSFIYPSEAPKSFDIDRRSGSLVVIKELDRESCAEYRLEVRILDTSTNPQSSAVVVKIEILDANDNRPKWKTDPLRIHVPEDSLVGTTVWNFSATDADIGANKELRYGLVNQWPTFEQPTFAVDSLTGNLIVASPLDYETVKEFILVVNATDQATNTSQRLSAVMTVQVLVQDTNDNAPVILSPIGKTIFVDGSSSTKGSRIDRIAAIDRDSGENGRLQYAITGGNEGGQFKLDRDTGELTLTGALTFTRSYPLNVTVSDRGSPVALQTTVGLNVTSQPKEENALKFVKDMYRVNVSEDLSIGRVIFAASSSIVEYTSGHSNNIRYEISSSMADDVFALNDNGAIVLKKSLDRETKDRYVLPLYAKDVKSGKYDSTTLVVDVLDENDNAPTFNDGSCYELKIPENMPAGTVHTVVAVDRDLGNGAKIVYAISEGNIGNKFHIDSTTGELIAQPLDREMQSRYRLTISAQDLGSSVSLTGYCNITITVEDENDNDPQFEKSSYAASVAENAAIGTSVLEVRAVDSDAGSNAQIVYSLKNETDWSFRIDNKTGIVTTNGPLDREKQSVYTFQVIATDNGRYRSQYQIVNVQINVDDANDNRPEFGRAFYTAQISPHTHAGGEVLKLSAVDGDQGANGEIVYRISNDYQTSSKFRINSNSGSLTTATTLSMSDVGRTFYVEVTATDRGSPSTLSSSCVIEIKIENEYETTTTTNRVALRFPNSSYTIRMAENAIIGANVTQVFALRSDGRRQKTVYNITIGNENDAFEIGSNNGLIRVRNSSALDYETNPVFRLVLAAQTDSGKSTPLMAFAELVVLLTDVNDNAPIFSQEQYFASVLEGVTKGTYVIRLLAVDADSRPQSRISYHIVDGNHDNAFVIEPPTSNVIKTNIVLDAEIRDAYKLTIIATDDGIPQLTGTATIRISVIDVNDNQPSFPPSSTIRISEGLDVGSVVTSVVANDVDSFPSLVYSMEGDEKALATFAIDRYSGLIVLKKALDFENKTAYQLRVTASDQKHEANTVLMVNVTDENDNLPIFDRLFYQFALPSNDGQLSSQSVLRVHATDSDSGEYGRIKYSLVSAIAGVRVDKNNGIISINQTKFSKELLQKGFFDVSVKAANVDENDDEIWTTVPVKFDTRYCSQWNTLTSLQSEYRVSIRENAPKGKTVIRLYPNNVFDRRLQFKIIDGNKDNRFDIISSTGDIILLNELDRENVDVYSLVVSVGHNVSTIRVHIIVEDVNDNVPRFASFERTLLVSETTPLNSSLVQFHAVDDDLPPNSDVRYEIISGNDDNYFAVDAITGQLYVKRFLDCDTGIFEHNLVIRATDVAKPPQDLPLSTLAAIRINVTDENDNEPRFPISEYLEFVAENEPIGVAVFTARATDADKGVYGRLNYSIVSAAASGYADVDDSWKLFKINSVTGLVSTNAHFDYETRSRYAFTLLSCDAGGKCAKVKVRVEIESKDEFHPQFTERTFRFTVGRDIATGQVIGYVTATDRDKGPDGRVVYQLNNQHPYFKVNRTTGAIMAKKKLDAMAVDQDVSLVVAASSGRQGSLTNMSVVEIVFDPLSVPGINLASSANGVPSSSSSSSIGDWLIALFVGFVLVAAGVGGFFVFAHFKNSRQKNTNKSNLGGGGGGGGGQRVETYVDPGAFDTIQIRGTVGHTQFGPPKYDEIPTYRSNTNVSNAAAAATSELSTSEQSGSSGRGSAEDGEDVDEEIRMINEGQSRPRRNPDDDNLSDVSVHNTQEYLARLGIIDSHPNSNSSVQNENTIDMSNRRQPSSVNQMNVFDDDGANEADITNIIYAKLNDVASERGGSTQEEVDRNSSTGRATSSVDRTIVLDGYQVPNGSQLSMSGSLSSIVHSEEELTGSYNWDYLLDWGPQYQPLAHVFSEIARLKDDAASVKSGTSGTSSNKSKNHHSSMKTVPPPLLTNVAPRSVTAPVINARVPSLQGHSTPHHSQMLLLPRSPIGHDSTNGFSTSAAMSPSFSPSLSPLATRSPSVSPLHLHTMGSGHRHHRKQLHHVNESDIRI